MNISEIFVALQGEGRFQGTPVLFIRTSGCTRACSWCDTKYHTEGKEISIVELKSTIKRIVCTGTTTVVWTGGEPLMQLKEILEVMKRLPTDIKWHLETNGDLITDDHVYRTLSKHFNYIAISPKCLKTGSAVYNLRQRYVPNNEDALVDIKVVTDLEKINTELVFFATSLMPYTTYNREVDDEVRKKVWMYCVEHNLHYSARLHTLNFGNKRGV